MSTLKGILFSQFVNEGLVGLVEEMQTKYKPKKGRRFNHDNITYEVGRSSLNEGEVQIEISSKIPQDDLQTPKEMKTYFSELKKAISHGKKKPDMVEMENIVWGSKKDSEKERDYVKVIYKYALDEFYDNKEIKKRQQALDSGTYKEKLPEIPSIFTNQGRLVLQLVSEKAQEFGRGHLETLIAANAKVQTKIK